MVSPMVDAKVVSTNNLLQRCTLQSDIGTKSRIIDVFRNKYQSFDLGVVEFTFALVSEEEPVTIVPNGMVTTVNLK